MYAELHEYLLLHHHLPLPGLGLFQVKRYPAVLDFPNRQIEGPGYAIEWQDDLNIASENLSNWLAVNSNITLHDARHRLEKFIFQLKTNIAAGDIIHWKGIGDIQKQEGKVFQFTAEKMVREGIVPANKVIREKAEHMVKVGEEERTSEQMTALLSEKKKIRFAAWQITAAVLTVLLIGFLAWHLSRNDWDPNAANQQPLRPDPVNESTYTLHS